MIKAPSGFPVQSPYLSIANRQTEFMMRIASEFGFTPASRSRISTPPMAEPTLFDVRKIRSSVVTAVNRVNHKKMRRSRRLIGVRIPRGASSARGTRSEFGRNSHPTDAR